MKLVLSSIPLLLFLTACATSSHSGESSADAPASAKEALRNPSAACAADPESSQAVSSACDAISQYSNCQSELEIAHQVLAQSDSPDEMRRVANEQLAGKTEAQKSQFQGFFSGMTNSEFLTNPNAIAPSVLESMRLDQMVACLKGPTPRR